MNIVSYSFSWEKEVQKNYHFVKKMEHNIKDIQLYQYVHHVHIDIVGCL